MIVRAQTQMSNNEDAKDEVKETNGQACWQKEGTEGKGSKNIEIR